MMSSLPSLYLPPPWLLHVDLLAFLNISGPLHLLLPPAEMSFPWISIEPTPSLLLGIYSNVTLLEGPSLITPHAIANYISTYPDLLTLSYFIVYYFVPQPEQIVC